MFRCTAGPEVSEPPGDFEKMLDRELKLWTGVVNDAKITVE